MAKDDVQVDIVVRKKPKAAPYAKVLKNGTLKILYEVTQDEMNRMVTTMSEQGRSVVRVTQMANGGEETTPET